MLEELNMRRIHGVVVDDGIEFVPRDIGKPPSFRDVRQATQVAATRRSLLGPQEGEPTQSADDDLPPAEADMDMDFET